MITSDLDPRSVMKFYWDSRSSWIFMPLAFYLRHEALSAVRSLNTRLDKGNDCIYLDSVTDGPVFLRKLFKANPDLREKLSQENRILAIPAIYDGPVSRIRALPTALS